MLCKNCSKELEPSFQFCPWCGHKVNHTTTTKRDSTRRHKRPADYDFRLAREIYVVWDNELYSPKYPNLEEYGKHEIGFKKAHTYYYRAVGEKFVDDKYQLRFVGGGHWNIEQVVILTKLSLREVNELIKDNIIHAEMTCNQLREIVRK